MNIVFTETKKVEGLVCDEQGEDVKEGSVGGVGGLGTPFPLSFEVSVKTYFLVCHPVVNKWSVSKPSVSPERDKQNDFARPSH